MSVLYWEQEVETLPLEEIRAIQLERLKAVVKRAYENTIFYRKKFDQAKVKPEDIQTLADLQKLPLTHYLEDFAASPLEEKVAVPWESVTEIMTTSGTISGFTLPIALTDRDMEESFNIVARTCRMAGVRPDDIVQLLLPWDVSVPMFKKLSSRVISSMAGRMILNYQIELAKLLKSTVVFAMPSYVLRFISRAKEMGIDLKRDTSLRLAILGGEPLADAIKRAVEEETGIALYELYGFAEASGIGGECVARKGLHIWADHYLLEIIDPESLQTLEPGEEGELVVTALTKEAMPLIRYRTGDLTRLLDDSICECGRTHPRITPVRGRIYHRFEVQGTTLLPSDIEYIVLAIPGLSGEFRIHIGEDGHSDRLKIVAEHASGVLDIESLRVSAEATFKNRLGLDCQLELVPRGALPQTQFKAQRIVRSS